MAPSPACGSGELNAIQKHNCFLCSPFYVKGVSLGYKDMLGELKPQGPKGRRYPVRGSEPWGLGAHFRYEARTPSYEARPCETYLMVNFYVTSVDMTPLPSVPYRSVEFEGVVPPELWGIRDQIFNTRP